MYPVTILIPVYTHSTESLTWLDECFESARKNQCDIVMWDDGSTDPTAVKKVCKKYSIKYRGSHKNNGPSYARNRCVESVTTDLIFPLDCDDVLAGNAIETLLDVWDGKTPVFPDLWKFGTEQDAHYRLLDWSCKAQMTKLGIAPVNVLHAKAQWQNVGGWDERFKRTDIYEDSEYNARLFFTYCARNLHLPLVGYRRHESSRIHLHERDKARLARQMLHMIGGYSKMAGCCGKNKRRSPSNAPEAKSMAQSSAVSLESLPGASEGMVWARYVGGKGKLRHYYRGLHTKYPYKVQYGQVLQVDANDAREVGAAGASKFVTLKSEEAPKEPEPQRTARPKPAWRESA